MQTQTTTPEARIVLWEDGLADLILGGEYVDTFGSRDALRAVGYDVCTAQGWTLEPGVGDYAGRVHRWGVLHRTGTECSACQQGAN